MASWQSYTHVVGTRTFAVLEHTTDQIMVNGIATGASTQWRTVQDVATGEVVREFKPAPNAYSPAAYNFDEGQQWLEKRFSPPQHGFAAVPSIPKIGDTDTDGWRCTEVRSRYGNEPPITTWELRDEKRMGTRVQKRQAGHVASENFVADQTMHTVANWSSIATYASNNVTYTFHKQAAPAAEPDKNTEHDMAQRHEFTFPYTGAEIAAALEHKAAKLDAQQLKTPKLDQATLRLVYPNYTDEDIAEVVKTKQREVERKNEQLAKDAAEIRKEALPYAKAGKASFDIDIEDIEHFGLNDEDSPVKAKRTRRSRAEIEAEKAQELVTA